jgi:hypothetical protein
MLLIHVVGGPGLDVRHEWFDSGSKELLNDPWLVEPLSIGDIFADLELPGVRPYHLQLDQPRPGEVVVRLASPTTQFFIDGVTAVDGARLEPHQTLRFENYSLSYTRTHPLSPNEVERLATITPGSEAWRVLADELAEAGKTTLAEWMRVNRTVSPGTRALLAELGKQLMPSERAMVGTAKIVACELDGCLGSWDALTPSDEPRFRSCGRCKRDVPYCATFREAESFARMHRPVAVDAGEKKPRSDWPHMAVG